MSKIEEKTHITSLAAPSDEDLAALRAMSEDERNALIAAHIDEGTRDIAEGRYTTLASDEDIKDFFDKNWPIE